MIQEIITILGLCVFEVVCSVDNAVVNANVLKTVGEKQKKFFLTWGLFIAVFVMTKVFIYYIYK